MFLRSAMAATSAARKNCFKSKPKVKSGWNPLALLMFRRKHLWLYCASTRSSKQVKRQKGKTRVGAGLSASGSKQIKCGTAYSEYLQRLIGWLKAETKTLAEKSRVERKICILVYFFKENKRDCSNNLSRDSVAKNCKTTELSFRTRVYSYRGNLRRWASVHLFSGLTRRSPLSLIHNKTLKVSFSQCLITTVKPLSRNEVINKNESKLQWAYLPSFFWVTNF